MRGDRGGQRVERRQRGHRAGRVSVAHARRCRDEPRVRRWREPGRDRARGELVVFVNPDAELAPGALASLAGALAEMPDAGIAGGGLVDPSGRWQPGAARFGALGHLLLDTTLGRLPARLRTRPYVVDLVDHLHGGPPRPLPATRRLRSGLLPLRRGHGIRPPGGGDRRAHDPRSGRARHARCQPECHPALRPRSRGRGGEGELRYGRRRPHQVRLFRALAACKFGAKAGLAAVIGRGDRAHVQPGRPRVPDGAGMSDGVVTLAVPCRTDEPASGGRWRQRGTPGRRRRGRRRPGSRC